MIETEIKWHKASEELPEHSCSVVIITGAGYIVNVCYSSKHKSFNASDGDSKHWALKTAFPVEYWAYYEEFVAQLPPPEE